MAAHATIEAPAYCNCWKPIARQGGASNVYLHLVLATR